MKFNKLLYVSCLVPLMLTSCKKQEQEEVIDERIDSDVIFFNDDSIINTNFGGLGVEWGTYEDNKKLIPDAKTKITNAVDYLNPCIVRCMFNYDWICSDLNTYNNDDKNDDTWTYDFSNERMISCCEVLEYCQNNNIDVAFGGWNVIGNADPTLDEWGMMEDCTSDPRWATMTADILNYLVNDKGYTCIKWFVNTNEPNWTGLVGQSKMAHNNFQKWSQGVRNVRNKLDSYGLNSIDIVGGDTTGFGDVALEYMEGISTQLKDILHNYGAHFYIDNRSIITNTFQDYLTQLYTGIKANDSNLGVTKPFYIWEAGLSTGKNSDTDCNALIRNVSYGTMMADYTVQAVLAGINGVCYWDLDDAMHFMYSSNGNTPKEWGMFSTLASAPISDQDYRPWFYSSVLLSNALQRGSKVFKTKVNTELNTIASVSSDNTDGNIIVVNHGIKSVNAKLLLQHQVTNTSHVYVYIYNENSLRIDQDAKVEPNIVIDGSINDILEITIPSSSLVVISSSRIGG